MWAFHLVKQSVNYVSIRLIFVILNEDLTNDL